jgi:hypothetical protein
MSAFTDKELDYLASQRLGRICARRRPPAWLRTLPVSGLASPP